MSDLDPTGVTGPLFFRSLYQERVWGGRALESALARSLPDRQKIGESWEIVDRPSQQSIVARGRFTGRSLRQLVESRGAAIMGATWDPARPFPILVKWLDCQQRLSLQVHPPASLAAELHGEPKTENWYIVHAAPSAALIAGLRRGVTREDFERGLADNTLEALVHRIPVRAGDSMFVPSGRVHAIGEGNLILEIQQNSDTTYRVHDWGRVDDDGRMRPLHTAEALRSIDFADIEPEVMRPPPDADVTLADYSEFRIRRLSRSAGDTFPLSGAASEARVLNLVHGAVTVDCATGAERFAMGDTVLLPADTPCEIRAQSDATLVVTAGFSECRPAAP